jgi:hypothetical protein
LFRSDFVLVSTVPKSRYCETGEVVEFGRAWSALVLFQVLGPVLKQKLS